MVSQPRKDETPIPDRYSPKGRAGPGCGLRHQRQRRRKWRRKRCGLEECSRRRGPCGRPSRRQTSGRWPRPAGCWRWRRSCRSRPIPACRKTTMSVHGPANFLSQTRRALETFLTSLYYVPYVLYPYMHCIFQIFLREKKSMFVFAYMFAYKFFLFIVF